MISGFFDGAPQLWHGLDSAFGYLAGCFYSAATWADHRAVLPEDDRRRAVAEIGARVRRPGPMPPGRRRGGVMRNPPAELP